MNFHMPNNYWMLSNGEVLTVDKEDTERTYSIVYQAAPYSMATPRGFSFVCTKSYFRLVANQSNQLQLTRVALHINYLQVNFQI
jgi:hypothetical protein